MEKQCKECEFWRFVKIKDGNITTQKGECLRFPPTLSETWLTKLGNRKPDDIVDCSLRPITDEADFCGEFVYKPADDQAPSVTVI